MVRVLGSCTDERWPWDKQCGFTSDSFYFQKEPKVMGKVIAIKDATRVGSADATLRFIDECYEKLEALPGFSVRPGQKNLSYDVCRSLVSGEPLAAEAPTGTGKTIAYLVGAIAAAEKMKITKDVPVVVATATVGLQTQILQGDLPRLVAAGILGENDTVLAKGRGRYFCAASAERLLEDGDISNQVDFFDDAQNLHNQAMESVQTLLEAWNGYAWTGDIDGYKGPIPKNWSDVAASSDTCVGQKCEHYKACPFFNARRALSSAKVIVANHDLVLADLAMAKEGQEPLFNTGRYLVVFDEAHHLPDKALDAGSAEVLLAKVRAELPKINGFVRAWQKHGELVRLLDKQKLSASDFDAGQLTSTLLHVSDLLAKIEVDEQTHQARFEKGLLPADLESALSLAHSQVSYLGTSVREAVQAFKQTNLVEKNEALKPVIADLLFHAAGVKATLSGLERALLLLTSKERAVRWLFRNDSEMSLHVSPLEGADVLRSLLWSSERVHVAMVSATLQDFDGFGRFAMRSGAPSSLRTTVLPHIFPYRENTMYLVEMSSSPRQEEKEKFIAELQAYLPDFIDEDEGTLILFPSRALMRHILPVLNDRFKDRVLVQNEMGIKELVKTHKKRIDDGRGSILCGLATLAEGLDLPGHYCTHVVICALPFTVPTSPVERELQEVLGKEYFAKRALPDALVKMVQMVGRLMRRETDRGRVTIFDKRLLYTKWGLKLLGALPAFKRKRVQPDDPPRHHKDETKLSDPLSTAARN